MIIKEEIRKVVSKGKAAGMLRLVFHDAGTFEMDGNSGIYLEGAFKSLVICTYRSTSLWDNLWILSNKYDSCIIPQVLSWSSKRAWFQVSRSFNSAYLFNYQDVALIMFWPKVEECWIVIPEPHLHDCFYVLVKITEELVHLPHNVSILFLFLIGLAVSCW